MMSKATAWMAYYTDCQLTSLYTCMQVWRESDRGPLFANDGDNAVKLSLALLALRTVIEFVAAAHVGIWELWWFTWSATVTAWCSSGVLLDMEPKRAYSHLLYAVVPVLNAINFSRLALRM